MSRKFLALCATLGALVATEAAAQGAPADAQLALARRYMAATNMQNNMAAMMDANMPMLLQDLERRMGATLDDATRDAFVSSASEAAAAITPKMLEAMAPVVATSFTQAELQAAVTYMESPEGRSLMAKSPAFMGKVAPLMEPLLPEMQADMQARVCRKIDCSKLGVR